MFASLRPAFKNFLHPPGVASIRGRLRSSIIMSDKLAAVPLVDIDDNGVFKYILINVFPKDPKVEGKITIVRGYKRCEWHADIYDEVMEKLSKLALETECLGGGRIQHDAADKKIKVYGYSQGFGRADHSIAVELLKKKYPEYTITWDNEGY